MYHGTGAQDWLQASEGQEIQMDGLMIDDDLLLCKQWSKKQTKQPMIDS